MRYAKYVFEEPIDKDCVSYQLFIYSDKKKTQKAKNMQPEQARKKTSNIFMNVFNEVKTSKSLNCEAVTNIEISPDTLHKQGLLLQSPYY